MPRLGAAQQDYPSRPIKIVLGFPPGGSTDLSARRVAEQLSRQMGQPFVVENRPGASGNIGAAYVARSAPDGYTLLYGTNTTHAMNVTLYPKLEYDPVKDFEPVVLQGKVSNVLSVNPAFEARTLPEFVALAKAQPGRINVASNGNSTSTHMALELFKGMAQIQVTHVPYKGSAPALTDVLGGQVPAIMDNLPASLPYIKAGKLRALAVTSRTRLPQLPDVPTFDELGLKGYEVAGWGAIWAPAGTPRPVVERLNREINLALLDPKVAAVMAETATQPQGGTSEELRRFAREETIKWRDVIRSANIRLD
ncbi:MAG: tripartite tricarboxylate transporter substrate binding protein [Variovorax sp.]|nr:MAG: tripartite tricarboxylate transporter substrate binding protein [Variovorax sp.]